MIKKNLKMYAVPAIYILAICFFGTSIYVVQRIVSQEQFLNDEDAQYVDEEIFIDNEYIPVVNTAPIIIKPFLNEAVTTSKTFYNYEGEEKDQENSLILYEGTYMQNTGTDYKYTEAFDVVSILDGTVIEITEESIMGKTIKIKHSNDLISTYQSLSEINVKQDEFVLQGQVIGKSGICNLYNKDSNLHLEISYQGKNIDPEKAYNKTEDEL